MFYGGGGDYVKFIFLELQFSTIYLEICFKGQLFVPD